MISRAECVVLASLPVQVQCIRSKPSSKVGFEAVEIDADNLRVSLRIDSTMSWNLMHRHMPTLSFNEKYTTVNLTATGMHKCFLIFWRLIF